MRVLLVDDNEDLLETSSMLIELYGHEVRACSSPLTAVETAEAFLPDLAILDIGMPGLNGYQLCELLRGSTVLRGLKIVAQSGYGDSESKRQAVEAGFDVHLLKPVATDDLERVLRERQSELVGHA